jgi:hypothetical protein
MPWPRPLRTRRPTSPRTSSAPPPRRCLDPLPAALAAVHLAARVDPRPRRPTSHPWPLRCRSEHAPRACRPTSPRPRCAADVAPLPAWIRSSTARAR